MNKYQEAFSNMCKDLLDFESDNVPRTTDQDYDLIKELVDREIPKKPIVVEHRFKTMMGRGLENAVTQKSCPECGLNLTSLGKITYCQICGQKLDWSDEE